MKILKTLGIVILVVIVVIILALGYFGFIPGLSTIFGSDKPKDLGIKYAQVDYVAAAQKNMVKIAVIASAPDAKSSLKWGGANQINNSWTSQQVTATINANSADWEYFPIKDVQFKINSDGSVEASGILSVEKLKGYAEATNVSAADIQTVENILNKFKVPKGPIPFYIKGNLSVKDDNVDVEVPKLEIGRLPIAQGLYEPAKSAFESFARQQLISGGYGSFYAKSLDFNNGKLNFSGTLPASVTIAKKVIGY